jgi:hypothetical protein
MTGRGAKGNETVQHFLALKEAERKGFEEAGAYAAAVAEIWQRDPERARKIGLPDPKLEEGANGEA